MLTIWKKVLDVADEQVIRVPRGAEMLHAGLQRGHFCVWYLCDPDPEVPPEERSIRICGTGHEVPDGPLRHLGTLLLSNDQLVFHVFEVLKPTT